MARAVQRAERVLKYPHPNLLPAGEGIALPLARNRADTLSRWEETHAIAPVRSKTRRGELGPAVRAALQQSANSDGEIALRAKICRVA